MKLSKTTSAHHDIINVGVLDRELRDKYNDMDKESKTYEKKLRRAFQKEELLAYFVVHYAKDKDLKNISNLFNNV